MVQHRQPLCSSTTLSLIGLTSRWSRPISPNSLMMTAGSASAGSVTRRLSSEVLPAPSKPVSTVSGIGSAGPRAFSGKVGTDLGFTRDQHLMLAKSARADLDGFPQKMRPANRYRSSRLGGLLLGGGRGGGSRRRLRRRLLGLRLRVGRGCRGRCRAAALRVLLGALLGGWLRRGPLLGCFLRRGILGLVLAARREFGGGGLLLLGLGLGLAPAGLRSARRRRLHTGIDQHRLADLGVFRECRRLGFRTQAREKDGVRRIGTRCDVLVLVLGRLPLAMAPTHFVAQVRRRGADGLQRLDRAERGH